MELFERQKSAPPIQEPFALRVAPKALEEFSGQEHLMGKDGPIRQAIESKTRLNAIFFGPPGCGKTALARLISRSLGLSYVEFSCVTTGIAKIKEAIAASEIRRDTSGNATLLVLDEIHHLNRTQQDVLLPYMENGVVCVVGLTTENPFFYIHKAVLSRALIFEFKPLESVHLEAILERALEQASEEKTPDLIGSEAKKYLVSFAGGDARKMLNALEFLTKVSKAKTRGPLKPEEITRLLGQRQQVYDRGQDNHYNLASAFIKAMRGSDPDASIYWMARMLKGGEDPRFIARRIVIAASEDVGNADSMALVVAQSAFNAVELLGLPEGAIPLAHAAIYVACAPKSNACYMALQQAQAEAEKGPARPVPPYLADSHTPGHEEGYLYPHDQPGHFVKQAYWSNPKKFYEPSDQGLEAKIRDRLDFLWKDKR